MEKLLKNIEFDDKVIDLKDIVKDNLLPVAIKVKSECLLSDRKSLQEGDIVTIHAKKIVSVLKGRDSQGRDVNLLTTSEHLVQLALPDEERVSFGSLKELCEKESRPKFVEIKLTNAVEVESIKDGDRLKVLLVERGANGPLFMHFRNEKGKHVRLPVDIEATFTACPPDGKEYLLSEIANITKAPLALFIQFAQTQAKNFESLGIVEIVEQKTIELLYLTLKDNGKLQCCVCLCPENLATHVPRGFSEKTEEYENVRQSILDLVDVEKFNDLSGNGDPLQSDPFVLVQYDKVFPKKKSKDKADRAKSLAVESDGNLSDKEKKRNSVLAFFKDDKNKESDEEKKEKKGKKSKGKEKMKREKGASLEKGKKQEDHKSESSKEDASKAEQQEEKLTKGKKEKKKKQSKVESEHGNIERDVKEVDGKNNGGSKEHMSENDKQDASQPPSIQVVTENTEGEGNNAPHAEFVHVIELSQLSPALQKKRAKEEKKKWKLFANEKKEKKKKGENGKGDSMDRNLSAQISRDSSSGASAPNSPSCDPCMDDDYELPTEIQNIAAQNMPAEDPHGDKAKSSTIISRTWKKMKKKRARAMSAGQMKRSHSDGAEKKNRGKSVNSPDFEYDDENPPPLLDADYPDNMDDIYEQIPGEFLSQDIYEEAVRAYGVYETAVTPNTTETGDSGFDELDQKALENLREAAIPPPLPGNHPKMQPGPMPRRGSSLKGDKLGRVSVDSEGFRKFYESMRASEAQMRKWGPEEIEKGLQDLQLGHHCEKFNESQVDGSLLVDLDEAVLRDLGLTAFEARKLRKFVFGWRPDFLRDAVYEQKYSKTSKNPSYWSTKIVADIIGNELGLQDFAKFCAGNQVNGDLLRDLVVDEELLDALLTGKGSKLNAVKLKNFVLDGWRPPKKKEGHYESVGSEESNKKSESGYEPLSPATPKSMEFSDVYEEPVSPSAATSATKFTGKKSSGPSSPVRISSDTDSQRKSSREHAKLVGATSVGVNSLTKKYETKSSRVDAPRPFTKKVSMGNSPSTGANLRTMSDAPFIANMKKKFNDKQ